MRLEDDGTLDTVVACDGCGELFRYNWDGGDEGDERDEEAAYQRFVEWALSDAATEHVCPPCAVSMGCLCAGHARGNDATEPCDTSEEP